MANRLIFLLAILCLLVPITLADAAASPSTAPATPVAIVSLHGEVDDYSIGLLERQINQARQAGAKTVIIDMDTNGGAVGSALDMTHFLRMQNDLHIIAYINRAYSAGAMISVACNEIVMAPDSAIGDCAPIIFKRDATIQPLDDTERAKEASPILNDFDASADRAGYDRYLLESMVVIPHEVYWVEQPDTHLRRFVDQKDHDQLLKEGWKAVAGIRDPINGPFTLLTVQSGEAVKLGLATGTAPSAEALAAERGKLVADLSPGSGEKIVEFLNSDGVRAILITLFLGALTVVFGSPGHGFAESVAVISLGLLLGVPLLTGYATWWEVVIIFTGLGLLAFEVFVFPGHGVSAVLGLIMLLGGLLLTFVGPQAGGGILPETSGGWLNLRHGAMAIGGAMFTTVFLAVWLQKYLPKLPYFSRLILTTTSGGGSSSESSRNSTNIAPENVWPGVGTSGVAVTDLRPGGSAEFLDLSVGDNRPVAVISETGYVAAGSKLVVRESRGNRIVVRPVNA